MQGVYPQIRELGGEVLAISFTKPERVAAYVQEMIDGKRVAEIPPFHP